MSQITTLTFFRYSDFYSKTWGFMMMQFSHPHLQNVKGQGFYKLMGSGKGDGFNPFPDWSVYALLQVWENEAAAQDFFDQADIMERYRKHASETWTIYMKSIMAKGLWSGKNPFTESSSLNPDIPYLAVITRATIKTSRLIDFWRYVPNSQKQLGQSEGLLFAKGIGEAPVVQMATFSLWENADAMKAFAYKGKGHQTAIKKTHELNWYKEELFSRFQPYKSVGTLKGVNPLADLN
jgi:heme-degrading monooxygenase HmoA